MAFTHGERGVAGDRISGSRTRRRLITTIRAQPLGAVIGSTPALMDAPSLDPPPDNDYGFPDSIGTFAGDHKDRRSILFFGANDGMIHADRREDGFRGVGIHPLQPAAEAQDAARRSAGGTVRFLRRQLAKDRRGQVGRRLAIAVDHGGGRRRNVLSDVRRDRSGYGRRTGRGRTLRGQRDARQVRRAERVDRVQVGVPELLELQSSLLRDVHCFGRHVGRQGQAVWRPQVDSVVRREDRRVHMVGSRRRHGGQLADDDRRHRRVGLLPRHRDTDSRASGRTEGGERPVSAQCRHGNADRQRVGIDMPDDRERQRQRIRLRQYRRRQQRTEERAPGRSDGRWQQRQLCRSIERISAIPTASTGASRSRRQAACPRLP